MRIPVSFFSRTCRPDRRTCPVVPFLGAVVAVAALLAPSPGESRVRAGAPPPLCGNGVVDEGEDCDPGTAVGSPDCDPLCRRIVLEPPGLPFGRRTTTVSAGHGRVYSPSLFCSPAAAREGSRLGHPVVVPYRIHLCRNAQGQDAFHPDEVREAMEGAAAEFAAAGILLEEESLVRFLDDDCDLPFDAPSWEDVLRENTPEGVVALSFVSGITSSSAQFSIGGFCYFSGPLCVLAGAFPSLIIHEVGHFLGLAHTFECAFGRETSETCSTDGDLLCDTPPDRGPKGYQSIAYCEDGLALNGSCSGTCGAKVCTDGSIPDSYNWMSYYHCEPGSFSSEQLDFMRCMLDHEMAAYRDGGAGGTSTTSSSSTTTTLSLPLCGDLSGDGRVSALDALGILRVGVGDQPCPLWICDFNGSGNVTAADALAVLRSAVGEGGPGLCPPRAGL